MPRQGFGAFHMAVRARREAALESASIAGVKNGSEKSVIICTNPRSGSWLLSEGLASTGLAGNPKEWFNPFHQQRWRARWRMRFQSDMNFAQYLRVIRRRSRSANGIFGIKLHAYQLRYLRRSGRLDADAARISQARSLETLFPDARYVWLTRRDRTRQAISLERAFASNQWWSIGAHPKSAIADSETPAPDPAAIARWEAALEAYDAQWSEFFRANGIAPTQLVYEDLVADYEGSIRSILRMLEVPEANTVAIPPPRLRRQSDSRSELSLTQYQAYRAGAGAAALRFPSIDAEDPIEARCRHLRSVIPPAWKAWIAQGRRQNLSGDALAAVLVSNGYDPTAARAAVDRTTAEIDPRT